MSFAGGFSALPATLLMTPIERVKVLLQTQKAPVADAAGVMSKAAYSGARLVVEFKLTTGVG